MCLSIPGEVVEIRSPEDVVVDVGGVKKSVSATLLPDLKVGEFVLIHVGHCLTKIDRDEALKTLELFQQIFPAELDEGSEGSS